MHATPPLLSLPVKPLDIKRKTWQCTHIMDLQVKPPRLERVVHCQYRRPRQPLSAYLCRDILPMLPDVVKGDQLHEVCVARA